VKKASRFEVQSRPRAGVPSSVEALLVEETPTKCHSGTLVADEQPYFTLALIQPRFSDKKETIDE
jgi:hypothetical protein